MTPPPRAPLYSPRLLALAVELAEYPYVPDSLATGEARSRTCGSAVMLSSNDTGRILSLGLQVTACAVGQAAAAIFAAAADGLEAEEIGHACAEIAAWLGGTGGRPVWPGIDALAPALPHKGRHEAILLPWRAALDALSKPDGHR